MNLRITVSRHAGTWRAQLDLACQGLTAEEEESLLAHGPCEVDVGGLFSGAGMFDGELGELTDSVEFELEDEILLLPTGLPYVREFDPLDSLDTETGPRAAIWAETMRERTRVALTSWLALSEIFERDTLHTLP